jgi:hypothetical protein
LDAAIVALETAAAGPKQSHDAGVAAIGVYVRLLRGRE